MRGGLNVQRTGHGERGEVGPYRGFIGGVNNQVQVVMSAGHAIRVNAYAMLLCILVRNKLKKKGSHLWALGRAPLDGVLVLDYE
jgi:hypothetical protein